MKQFVKALVSCICAESSLVLDAKIKERIFVGPDIRMLMNDENFESCLGEAEEDAWISQ